MYQIDENVQKEIINHRSLKHPNIIRFRSCCNSNAFGDSDGICCRSCSGGYAVLVDSVKTRLAFSSSNLFSYCHSMEICHRDLKLENTLLDGNPTPRLKICDFG